MEFLRNLHRAQRLAIPFGIGHAEVAVNLLLGVAGFLMANHHYVIAMKTCHAANDGRIIGVTAITVDFAPVGEDTLDVIQGIGTLRMPCQFCFFPCAEMG